MKVFNCLFIISLGLLSTLVVGNTYAQKTESKSELDSIIVSKIERIGIYYQTNKFSMGYELIEEIFAQNYKSVNARYKPVILELGIKLSFALDYRDVTLKYLSEYFEYSTNFSSKDLSEITPQLKLFIDKFLISKNMKSVFVNKHPQDIDLVPASVTVYTREEIEQLGVRNIMDLIRMTPGFAEVGDNNELVFGTRGVTGTTLQDILFLINGHRLTDLLTSTNAPDWVSLNYVEQLEIVLGPGSSLFGGSAFSGVVNIITKSGTRQNGGNISLITGNGNSVRDLSGKYNSYNLNFDWAKRFSNTEGVYVSATLNESGGSEIDYADSKDRLVLPETFPNSKTRAADYSGKEYINKYGPGYDILLNYNNKSLQITANAQSSMFIYSRPSSQNLWYSLNKDSLQAMRRRIDKKEFIKIEYDLFSNNERLNRHSLVIKVAEDHFQKDFYSPIISVGNAKNIRLMGDEYRGTVNLEFSTNSLRKEKASKNNYFLVGVEAFANTWFYNVYEELNGNMFLTKIGDYFSPKPSDQRLEYSGAAYMQSEHHLIKNKLVATAGVRINYHSVYSTFDKFEWGQQYSPRFAMVYVPKRDTSSFFTYKFKLVYNSAFLPPPFLYRKGGIFGYAGNTNLTSQVMESGEFVIFGNLGRKTRSSSLTYNFTKYINKIDNRIARVDNVYINEPTARRIGGAEAELKYNLNRKNFSWAAFINYSYVKQQDFKESGKYSYLGVLNSSLYSQGDSLQLYPKSYLKAGLNGSFFFNGRNDLLSRVDEDGYGYTKGFKKITAGTNIQWIGPSSIQSNYVLNDAGYLEDKGIKTMQEIKAAFVVNCFVKVFWRSLNLGASVFNLQNTEYQLPSPISKIQRQRAEGRMIYLTIGYSLKN